jgi:hypothetical protein
VKHFMNRELLAPNVATFNVDFAIVRQFSRAEHLRGELSTVRPHNWHSDIKWVSAADEEAFSVFQQAFDGLGIAARAAPFLDLKREVRLYAGFVVVRSHCIAADFHVDWTNTNNEAFTCLTPISPSSPELGLLYRQLTGQSAEYRYVPGEAIAFGEGFAHSTKPGTAAGPETLLCFEYGTDKMEHWPNIYSTVGRQVTHLRQPDGRFVRAEGTRGW